MDIFQIYQKIFSMEKIGLKKYKGSKMGKCFEKFLSEFKANTRYEVFLLNGIKLLGKIVAFDEEGFILEDFVKKTNETVWCYVDRVHCYSVKAIKKEK